MHDLALGIDFGTDSCRAVLVDVQTGAEVSSAVAGYKRWAKGLYCDPRKNQFRQHPLDYIEAMEEAVRGALTQGGKEAGLRIVGIGIDTTGSTPCAANEQGQPLALTSKDSENPAAMFVLWKDHTAVEEAISITRRAKSWGGIDFTRFIGGVYSAEWFWAKILRIYKEDPQIKDKAFSFLEHCDWMPALLTGVTSLKNLKRSRCAMGHKAMWHREWGGYPSDDFLSGLDPALKEVRKSLGSETFTSNVPMGELTDEWATRLGLRAGIPVAVGALDAHIGAAGAGVRPGVLVKVIGTSTCDMTVGPLPEGAEHPVEGICGQVDGSILPGYIGYEAGQSAYGDVYAWFKRIILWPLEYYLHKKDSRFSSLSSVYKTVEDEVLPLLEEVSSILSTEEAVPLSVDWMNGRRTPYANQLLKGAITGITLGTDAPLLYRSLIEATAFGARAIVERFQEEGIEISKIVGIGGVARKSPLNMQILSDVLQAPIEVLSNDQTVAIGAALFGAVVGGVFSSAEEAQKVLVPPVEKAYIPRPEYREKYTKSYEHYKKLGVFIEQELTGGHP